MNKQINVTKFQEQVYKATKMIPEGKPGACQAVGNALRNNPFAPVVPCHRVLPSSYQIGGFFGETSENSKEVQKKMALLKSEGIQFDKFEVKNDEFYRKNITFDYQ